MVQFGYGTTIALLDLTDIHHSFLTSSNFRVLYFFFLDVIVYFESGFHEFLLSFNFDNISTISMLVEILSKFEYPKREFLA